jgi:hypothetical protein
MIYVILIEIDITYIVALRQITSSVVLQGQVIWIVIELFKIVLFGGCSLSEKSSFTQILILILLYYINININITKYYFKMRSIVRMS